MPSFLDWRLRGAEWSIESMRRAAMRKMRAPLAAPHLELGERGEEAALFHLRREGYVIVARRWKSARHRGDIDLIGWEGDTLCFIEVKTRGDRDVASAESAVDEEKRRVLRRLARVYLKALEPAAASVRFDLLSIYFEGERKDATLFRYAFGW